MGILNDPDPVETREWVDSLRAVLRYAGPERARYLLTQLRDEAARHKVILQRDQRLIRVRRLKISIQRAREVLETQERTSKSTAETAIGVGFVLHAEELRWGLCVALGCCD